MVFLADAFVRARQRVLQARPLTFLLALAALFGLAYVLMSWAEGEESNLSRPWGFFWWFVVTTFTVGYGDSFPTTTAGQAVAIGVMVLGIALMTTLVAALATVVVRVRSRSLKGLDTVKVHDAVLIVGYQASRTEALVEKLVRDLGDDRRHLVLVSPPGGPTEHPIPDMLGRVRFVTGDVRLPDTMRRAGVERASGVIIDVGDDTLVLPVLLAVRNVTKHVPVVAALLDTANDHYLEVAVPDDTGISSVERGKLGKIAHEVLHPGVNDALNDLEDPEEGDAATYRIEVGDDTPEVDWLAVGMRMLPHGAVPLSLLWEERGRTHRETCPATDTVVRPGMAVIYAARAPLPAEFTVG